MKLPKKEEIVGKTQKQIDNLLKKEYPELKVIRDAFQAVFKKEE